MILSITYCSIINQTLVVFSMVFENITQYVPLDHSVLKHFLAVRSMVYKSTIQYHWTVQWYNQASMVLSMVFKNTIRYHWTTCDFKFAAAHLINQLLLHSYIFYVFFIINWDTLFWFFIFYYNWLLIECLIVLRQLISAGLIVGYLNLYEMNLCSQCSVDHIIRMLNILEIYISNRHRCRMEVHCYA